MAVIGTHDGLPFIASLVTQQEAAIRTHDGLACKSYLVTQQETVIRTHDGLALMAYLVTEQKTVTRLVLLYTIQTMWETVYSPVSSIFHLSSL